MKTMVKIIIYSVLFCGFTNVLNAQEIENPQEELIENTWYLFRIEVDEENHFFESNEETEWTTLTIEQVENQTNFYLDYCQGAVGEELSFTSDFSFVINNFVVSLGECENPDNNNYRLMYFESFEENLDQVFEYFITMQNDYKTLVVSTQNNKNIYYQNVPYLSVKNQEKYNLVLYPNPAQEEIYIENLTATAEIEIYTISGKKLLQQQVNSSAESVNISNLSAGIYFYAFKREGKSLKRGKLIKE